MSQTSLDGEGVEQTVESLELDETVPESSDEDLEFSESLESAEDSFENLNDNLEVKLYAPDDFARYLEGFIGQHQPSVYDSSGSQIAEDVEELPKIVRPGLEEAANDILETEADQVVVAVDSYERDWNPRYLRYTEGEVSDQIVEEFQDVLGDPETYDDLDQDLRVEFSKEDEEYRILIQKSYSK